MNRYFFLGSVLVLCFFTVEVYAQDPRTNPGYLVDISEAYNHLEKDDYTQAGIVVRPYLQPGKHFADAHLIMGEIMLSRKFYRQAEGYFQEAEEGRDFFILPEQVIRLYWNQLLALSRSQKFSQWLSVEFEDRQSADVSDSGEPSDPVTGEKFEKIQMALQNLIHYASSHRGDYYQEQLAQAHFMLGRLWYQRDPLRGMQELIRAVQRNFLAKSSYLYMSYFFALQHQKVIDQVYQNSPQGPPLKRQAFLSYYRNYLDAEEDKALRIQLVPEPEYIAMKYVVDLYYRNLQE